MARPLKVGLIGTGRMGRAHLPAYEQFPERVELAAVCDIREDAVRQYARDAGVEGVYTDVGEMLKDADIDAAGICTTHDQHLPQPGDGESEGGHLRGEPQRHGGGSGGLVAEAPTETPEILESFVGVTAWSSGMKTRSS